MLIEGSRPIPSAALEALLLVEQVDIALNPDFRQAQARVLSALQQYERVALYSRIQLLESQKRQGFFRTSGFKKLWVFPRFTGLFCFVWFIWQRGYSGDAAIGWL